MEKKLKTNRLFHRIKYRNLVDPNVEENAGEILKLFNVTSHKNQTHRKNMYKKAQKLKLKQEEQANKSDYLLLVTKSQPQYVMYDFFKTTNLSTPMSRFLERDILKRVAARGLEFSHETIVKNIITETKEEFLKITHEAGIVMKIKSPIPRFKLEPYKYLGRTNNYDQFLITRKIFKNKYLLHHSIVRKVFNKCIIELPYELFNLNLKYPMDIIEFETKLAEQISEISMNLREFYDKINKIVAREKNEKISNYLDACSGLLSVNLSRTIAHTILHVVNFTKSIELVPYLKLTSKFEDCFIIQPTAEDIIRVYKEFLKKVIKCGKQFHVLSVNKADQSNKMIYLCLTEEFFQFCINEITENIIKKYEPIIEYATQLDNQLHEVYSAINENGSLTDLKFEEGCQKIFIFKKYFSKIAYIPDNQYFLFCHLNLTDYREKLNLLLTKIIDNIFEKISTQHERKVNEICEAFETINMKAKKIPETTEEMIEISKYMTWVRNEYLDELKERVENSLMQLTKLIELGPLKSSHMSINSMAINWLDKIMPILDENYVLYEQLKFDAEEKLQRVIEEISVNINDVYPLLKILDDMDDITHVKDYLKIITLHIFKIKEINDKILWINQEEVCLSFPKSVYIEFDELKNYVYPFYHLLKICLDIQRNIYSWLDGQFELIKYKVTKNKIDDYFQELSATYKTYKSILRQAQDENLSIKFKGTVDDPDILNWPAPLKLCSKAMKLIDDFKPSLKIVKIMCNEALMKRHWKEMSAIAGFNLTPNAGTTLRKLIQIDLEVNIDKYDLISRNASKEHELLTCLIKIQNQWNNINFTISSYQKDHIQILIEFEVIENIINDHIIKILNMRSSIYVKPYINEIEFIYNKLLLINETIEKLKRIQSLLLHLLPLFSSDFIINQIQQEYKLLQQIKTIYKNYINKISINSRVMEIIDKTNILDDLISCENLFEIINRKVDNYIEEKRKYYPRLYFLTNPEIISILSLNTNPEKIQLKQIFDGVGSLEFNPDYTKILGFKNKSFLPKEIILLKNTIDIDRNSNCVVKWLKELTNEIKSTIKKIITQNFIEIDYENMLQKLPSQILFVIIQLQFTLKIEKALNASGKFNLEKYFIELNQLLESLIKLKKISPYKTSSTLQSLIISTISKRDFLEELVNNKITESKEFKWQTQLRYYLSSETNDCVIKVINSYINYGYEYIGELNQIILTANTERCYINLLVAYNFYLFGAIEGITGTGKSETLKNLTKLLAVYYINFNCDINSDFNIIQRFLTGMLFCSGWLSLNNFEKLNMNVISIISGEITKISSIIKSNLNEGINLNKNHCFICLLVNTNTKKTFPDSLNVLFRSVTMLSPDYTRIAEINLISLGFQNARNLAKKIIVFHKLFQELLFTNYSDYSLTPVNHILKLCSEKSINGEEDEKSIVYNSIKSINFSKLTEADRNLFNKILLDLFPNQHKKLDATDNKFMQHIKNTCEAFNIQYDEIYLGKLIELTERLKIYQSLIIIGDIFAGKTTTIKIMAKVLKIAEYEFINPKTLTLVQLYGEFNSFREWCDGAITRCFRNCDVNRWIIFDGLIDPVWSENLNSLLDSNNNIYLNSGELLTLPEKLSIIFETHNLSDASPAMFSRCGILYIDSKKSNWQWIIKSWIIQCKSEWKRKYHTYLIELFNWIIPPCIDYINQNCHQLMKTGSNINLIKVMIFLVEVFLNEAFETKDEDNKNIILWIQASFVLGGIWGFSSILDSNSYLKFDEFYKQLWRGQIKSNPFPIILDKIEIIIPQEGNLIDYNYVYKQKGNWKYWPDVLKTDKIDKSPLINGYFVPTTESIKFAQIVKLHLKYNRPILIFGPSGTGKTLYLQDILINKLDKAKYELNFINFTVNITANHLQKRILSKLNKKDFNFYQPSDRKFAIIFIDDLHMCNKDSFGTQSSIELIRQCLDHKNLHDLKSNNNQIFLRDINIISAMNLIKPHEKLCKRFLRHFNLFSINTLTNETITRIYSTILLTTWRKNGFPSDITHVVNQIVAATLQFYKTILTNFKSSFSKIFYQFNLKDFSKVIEGCSLLRKESFDANKKIYYKLWTHEVFRIFHDRICDVSEKVSFYQTLKMCIKENFNEEFEVIFENLPKNFNDEITLESFKRLFFGTYLVKNSYTKRYDDISDIKLLYDVALNSLKEYNEINKNKLDIVLFDYALEHLSRICRVLTLSCNNALLLGLSGSGRQTLIKLACQIFNYKLFQPKIARDYQLIKWENVIKNCLKEAGGFGNHCVFLLMEEQILNEKFLDDVDYLLKCGKLNGFYNLKEKQEILDLVRTKAYENEKDIDMDANQIMFYYEKLCRKYLHFILCLNPNNLKTIKWIQTYKSIINNCYIDYYEKWPDEALEKIAYTWIQSSNLISADLQQNLVAVFKDFHLKIEEISSNFNQKTIFITTAQYLDLIHLFIEHYKIKENQTRTKRENYMIALGKLSYAAKQISEMQKSLADYQPQLQAMTRRASEMTEEIANETIEVEKASNLVKQDEKISNEQAAEAQLLKIDCEADLAQAIPILEDAIQALNTLKPADITLVKSMKNPPDAIKLVMAAVCVIKDVKPDRIPEASTGRKILDYWGPSKRILGDMNFLQSLKDFDKDYIKSDIITKIRKEYLPHKDFKPHVVAKASSAAEGLCKWIIAMDMYDKVAKEVAPKKEKLEKAEKEYAETIKILNEKKEQVKRIEQKLADLHNFLDEATQKQKKLQSSVNNCRRKLMRAQHLIGGLSEEKIKWSNVVEELDKILDTIIGDILIASGVITYLGPFGKEFRQIALNSWISCINTLNIKSQENYNFLKLFESDIDINKLYLDELPVDDFFIENAIIEKYSMRPCIFIDPQTRAYTWIKNFEKRNDLKILKFFHQNILSRNTIEDCIIKGQPILIKNCTEEIDLYLQCLANKNIFNRNNIEFIEIDETVIKYNSKFKFYLTSTLKNPRFGPEIFNKFVILNFILTQICLDENFLTIIIKTEKPSAVKLKETIDAKNIQNKLALKEIEDNILNTLTTSEIDILDDINALKVLQKSKIVFKELEAKQKTSLVSLTTIDNLRIGYDKVAKISTILYSFVYDLTKINYIYQFSLNWFINVLIKSIRHAKQFGNLEKRCQSLIKRLKYELCTSINNSIFEKDKLLSLFLFYMKTNTSSISNDELNYLINDYKDYSNNIENPAVHWLTNKSWNKICNLRLLKGFENFQNIFIENLEKWKTIYDTDKPEHQIFPEKWNNNLSKLLIINAIRPERTYLAVIHFLENEMGKSFLNSPKFDLNTLYMESYLLTPIIFILTPETYPDKLLKQFANEKQFLNKLEFISLGDQEEKKIDIKIEEAVLKGLWICLQNCHLSTFWLESLEILLEKFEYDNTHENFRLWLFTNPTERFPVSLLENSTKVVVENPSSLRQKLLNLYSQPPINNVDFFKSCLKNHKLFTRLVYGLAFFHCLVQERKKFCYLSWTIPYEFSDNDFIVSLLELQTIIQNNDLNLINQLKYIIGQCNYLSHITNKSDQQTITALLSDYIKFDYPIPIKSDREDFIQDIKRLSESKINETIGLCKNFEYFKNLNDTNSLITSLNDFYIEQKEIMDLDKRSEILLSIINDLLLKIPKKFDLITTEIKLVHQNSSTVHVIMFKEIKHFNNLLDLILTNLNNFKNILQTHSLIFKEFEDLSNFLLSNTVPKTWFNNEYDSLTNYISNLNKKFNFFKTCLIIGKFPKLVDLSNLFYPKSYLMAIKLLYAQKNSLLLSEIIYDYKIIEKDLLDECLEVGTCIEGLTLIGAGWNIKENCLMELQPKIIKTQMPIIWFRPNIFNNIVENCYNCPVYKTITPINPLFNFIEILFLQTNINPSNWIKRNVRLYCDMQFE